MLQTSIYGDINAHTRSISLVKRNLQTLYADKLSSLVNSPARGTPSDAQAMARHELMTLRKSIGTALRNGSADAITRAHLENLRQHATLKSQ